MRKLSVMLAAATALTTFAAPALAVTPVTGGGGGNGTYVSVVDTVAQAGLTAMKALNLIVLNDLTANANEVEGKLYVGHNVTGGTFNVGIGSGSAGNTPGNSQSATASDYATITVGGALNAFVNVNNGPGVGGGPYGAVVGGTAKGFNLNGNGATATVKVGGNLESNLSYGVSGSTVTVGGSVKVLTLGDLATVVVGSTGDNLQVGANSNVKIVGGATGQNSEIKIGQGTTLAIGKTQTGTSVEGKLVGSNNTVVTASGSLTNQNAEVTTGNNSTLTVGGSVAGKVVVGTGSTASIKGSVTNSNGAQVAAGGTLNVGGDVNNLTLSSGSAQNTAKANIAGTLSGNFNMGDYSVTNVNTYTGNHINGATGAAIHINGAGTDRTGNGGSVIDYNAGVTFQTITAPAAPTAATAPDQSGATSNLSIQLTGLSNRLASYAQAAGNTVVTTAAGPNSTILDWTFKATDFNKGFASFNVGADVFSARNISFNLGGNTGPVIVNVTGLSDGGNYTFNGKFGGNTALNQQVIWNFGTSAVNVNLANIFQGSILSPNGSFTNSTPIEGSVAVKNFTMGGEVHLGTFNGATGFLTYQSYVAAVPEPATWAQMIVGFGLAGFALRRRRRIIAIAA